MSKELHLFEKDTLTLKHKFFLLMDLLVSNQTNTRLDSTLFLGIFFLQIISGFFLKNLEVFETDRSTSDKLLNTVAQIARIKDLFINDYTSFKLFIFLVGILCLGFLIFFFIVCLKTTKKSFYSTPEYILNFCTKTYIYIGFNIIMDSTLASFCFSDKNPYFPQSSCSMQDDALFKVVCIILIIFSVIFVIFIQFFYCDSLYLSTSFYAKISCNYEILLSLNCVVYSVTLVYAENIGKELFFIYNLASSIFLLRFFLNHYLFYDRITNVMVGIFHCIYVWTAIFFFIFSYISTKEKGLIYLGTSCIVVYLFIQVRFKLEENILLTTAFYQIKNQYYILYYIKNLIDKINHFEESPEEKALLTGIMQMHAIECPNPLCLSKTKKCIYLPITNEWSDRSKPLIKDQVYLLNFILLVMNFFIEHNYYSANMVINMSLYYLEIIGNYCLAMFYYKKVKEMKLTYQEYFSFYRLKLKISKALVEKLKPANESCFNLEDLNVTIYFKYEDLSKEFFDEMNNDVNLSLEFWRNFRNCKTDINQAIDFNKIFHLTDKIRITKSNVERLWGKLIKIFNGVNDLFNLYLEYVEEINDDDLQKRELEDIKRKSENSADMIQQNFFSVLFNKETGIIIANGDKGKEGIIHKANNEIETIFKYKPEEIVGMNLSDLMPKLFAKEHKFFMEKYFDIGEKKIIDHKDFVSFGKDKNNSIIMLKLAVKLFPMLNESVFFVSLIVKENIDDIIFIDKHFMIEGMSIKLMKILQIDNKLLFQDNEIPFYVICRKFVNFYKIFLQGQKQNLKNETKNEGDSLLVDFDMNNVQDTLIDDKNEEKKDEKEEKDEDFHENVEINENIELEYEIRLPQFLFDYSKVMSEKDSQKNSNLFKTNSEFNAQTHKGEEDVVGESDALVPKTASPGTKSTEGPTLQGKSKFKSNGTLISNEQKEDEDLTNQDEEKDFNIKIKKYKDLFDNRQFHELEDLIDLNLKNSTTLEFKFNFTFDRCKYGDRQLAYVIRCIDNKIDGGRTDDSSIVDSQFMKNSKYKKEKFESLTPLYQLFEVERVGIQQQEDNFIQMSIDNKSFQSLLQKCKEDITKMSMVHGKKKENIIDEENSSQTSQSGFNADLCKKNRIEEIRANIMNNVSNFYTLKYIKVIIVVASIITCIFCLLFLLMFFEKNSDLKKVSALNLELFQTTIWISNIVSSLIPLRSLFSFRDKGQDYTINSFIKDEEQYFKTLLQHISKWYNNTVESFGDLEYEIGKYSKADTEIFWGKEHVTYYTVDVDDHEGFPLGLSQVLININSLIQRPTFLLPINHSSLTDHEREQISYNTYLSIENVYENLLPSQFEKIKSIPQIFKDFNKSQETSLLTCILIFTAGIVALASLYDIFLFITNKSMGEGLEKVTKIKLERIEETIKRIENFNSLLKQYRDRDSNKVFDDEGKLKQDETVNPVVHDTKKAAAKTNPGGVYGEYYGTPLKSSSMMNGFNSEDKKHTKLKILSYSYLQTVFLIIFYCSFLFPIYLISLGMIKGTNKLLDVQQFLFGKLLITISSSIEIKCTIAQCETTKELLYENLINKTNIQPIIKGITQFKDLQDFYNYNFLSNACKAAYDEELEAEEYADCLVDPLVISANNTEALIKLVDETVININKEKESNGDRSSFELFASSSYNDLETVVLKYIAPVNDKMAEVFRVSLENYLHDKKVEILILVILYGLCNLLIFSYIAFAFVKKLIHLLSVSRCILKIIPTTVINDTQELESWIENRY